MEPIEVWAVMVSVCEGADGAAVIGLRVTRADLERLVSAGAWGRSTTITFDGRAPTALDVPETR